MWLIYILLGIIAVGVLLASEAGQALLSFLVIAAVIVGVLYLAFLLLCVLAVWAGSFHALFNWAIAIIAVVGSISAIALGIEKLRSR